MKIIKKIIRAVINVFSVIFVTVIKGVSLFIPKGKATIFCYPEGITCISNHIDIINYTADNTLSFINFLLRNYKGTKLTIYLLYFDINRINDYLNYVHSLQNDSLRFFFILYNKNSLKNKLKQLVCFMKSKYIFSSNVLEQRFAYKLKRQTYISLNYFATSFKLDKPRKNYKWPLEYVISTSLLSSQIISTFSNVPIGNFQTLGFPRNDNIIKPRFSKEQLINMLNVLCNINKIIIHTPTHRMGHNKASKKNVINYIDYFEKLCNILNKYNALLIIASHPSDQLVIDTGRNERIVLYRPNYQYTLYDILGHADVLITDYTTVYYDYLLTNRPVIFNFHDKDFYEKERGFAFEPVENICAGPIVKNKEELFNAIKQTLEGLDEHKHHRKLVTSLIHKYNDCDSSKRVLDFFKTKLNQ